MQCFAHPNEIAVGICKSCGKGVCRTCAIPLNRGLACSQECKPFVEALSRLQSTSIRNVGLVSAQRFAQPLMAVVFLVAAAYLFVAEGSNFLAWFTLALGCAAGFIGVLSWVRQMRSK
jgi:hypothetical protein